MLANLHRKMSEKVFKLVFMETLRKVIYYFFHFYLYSYCFEAFSSNNLVNQSIAKDCWSAIIFRLESFPVEFI